MKKTKKKKRLNRSLGTASSNNGEKGNTQNNKTLKTKITKRLNKITKKADKYFKRSHLSPKTSSKPLELAKGVSEVGYSTRVRSPKVPQTMKSVKTSLKGEKKQFQQEFKQLEAILLQKQQTCSKITFEEYLSILQMFKLVSGKILSEDEEMLVTKSWHQISFYSSGNIVTSGENIRVLITGLLSSPKTSMFRKQRNLSMNYQPKVGSKRKKSLDGDISGKASNKTFKFRNKAHVRHLQNEFFSLKNKNYEKISNENPEVEVSEPSVVKSLEVSTEAQSRYEAKVTLEVEEEVKNDLEDTEESNEISFKATEIPKIPEKFCIKEDLSCQPPPQEESKVIMKPISDHSQSLSIPGCSFPIKPLEPPALELDVYISENKMEKLIVYKQDNPEEITKLFSKKHNLPEEKQNLLLSVIKDQVSKVLTCISEEDEEIE